MRLLALALSVAPIAGMAVAGPAAAHCQIPCGIYDDAARLASMREDATTVAKAAHMLAELQGKSDAQSIQQQVRWVTNKEHHAQRVIDTIVDYFLTQRVKPSQADYAARLRKHHAVILAAVAAKQSAAPAAAEALGKAIEGLHGYYAAHDH